MLCWYKSSFLCFFTFSIANTHRRTGIFNFSNWYRFYHQSNASLSWWLSIGVESNRKISREKSIDDCSIRYSRFGLEWRQSWIAYMICTIEQMRLANWIVLWIFQFRKGVNCSIHADYTKKKQLEIWLKSSLNWHITENNRNTFNILDVIFHQFYRLCIHFTMKNNFQFTANYDLVTICVYSQKFRCFDQSFMRNKTLKLLWTKKILKDIHCHKLRQIYI